MSDKKEAKPEQPKFTPMELGRQFHSVKLPIWSKPGEELFDAYYAAADSLFGWAKQAHHYGPDSFKLTVDDFQAAIEAAKMFPTVVPPPAAIPPHSAEKFKHFKPKAKG